MKKNENEIFIISYAKDTLLKFDNCRFYETNDFCPQTTSKNYYTAGIEELKFAIKFEIISLKQ